MICATIMTSETIQFTFSQLNMSPFLSSIIGNNICIKKKPKQLCCDANVLTAVALQNRQIVAVWMTLDIKIRDNENITYMILLYLLLIKK